jgi:hypothetical protein
MKNPYLENLNKIEFVITDACTGRCKHCSEGEHPSCGTRIDPTVAANTVRRVAEEYNVQTVMTFGGEPLLYPDAVEAVMTAAKEMGIPRRQVITNGYFSKDVARICEVAQKLAACGVNDLLLSVDSFHQETIPLNTVKSFARAIKSCGIPLRLSPAWLVSREDDNPYNQATRKILHSFDGMDVPVGEGNVIFPEGNALKYLAEYFTDEPPTNPYIEEPQNLHCLSVSPDGSVLGGNLYEQDVMTLIENYIPQRGEIS